MPSISRGDVLGSDGRWRVVRTLGEGQFAEVFEVEGPGEQAEGGAPGRYALKLERRSETNTVLAEYKILRRLKSSAYLPRVLEVGEHDSRYFMVMDLLGRNLHCARSSFPGGRIDWRRVREIGVATLDALRAVHEAGYVHRDVKPANFVTGVGDSLDRWFIIDFGLARRFLDDYGQPVPERFGVGFRGSSTYASIHAQQERDQGRRDDLWSWLYTVVELLTGTLPWRHIKERHRKECGQLVLQKKMDCRKRPEDLTFPQPLPHALSKISEYLCTLEFDDTPNYDTIRVALWEPDALGMEKGDDQWGSCRPTCPRGASCAGAGCPGPDGQAWGSSGQPPVPEANGAHAKCPPLPESERELEGASARCLGSPPQASDRASRPSYAPNANGGTPDRFQPPGAKYHGSAQSVRSGVGQGWEGRMQDAPFNEFHPRYHGEGNFSNWGPGEDRNYWAGSPDFYREGGRFRGGPPGGWRSYKNWPNSQPSSGWNEGNFQSHSGYHGYGYGAEPGRGPLPWGGNDHQPYHGQYNGHGYPGGEWREWNSGGSQSGWPGQGHGYPGRMPARGSGSEVGGSRGPPGKSYSGKPGGPPADEERRPEYSNCCGGERGPGGVEMGGGAPFVVKRRKSECNGALEGGENVERGGGGDVVSDGTGNRNGNVNANANVKRRKKVDQAGKSDQEDGINFMQHCVNWVRSPEGPPRAKRLLPEFTKMDPLEGVALVASICHTLGTGKPHPAVEGVLSDLSAYAGFLAKGGGLGNTDADAG